MWETFDQPVPVFASILIVVLFAVVVIEGIFLYQHWGEEPASVETRVIYRERPASAGSEVQLTGEPAVATTTSATTSEE